MKHPSPTALNDKAESKGIGRNKIRELAALLIEEGELHEWQTPRTGTRPAKSYARFEQPKETLKETTS